MKLAYLKSDKTCMMSILQDLSFKIGLWAKNAKICGFRGENERNLGLLCYLAEQNWQYTHILTMKPLNEML